MKRSSMGKAQVESRHLTPKTSRILGVPVSHQSTARHNKSLRDSLTGTSGQRVQCVLLTTSGKYSLRVATCQSMSPPNLLNTAVVKEGLSETAAQATGSFQKKAQTAGIWEKRCLSKLLSQGVCFCAIVERDCQPQTVKEIGEKWEKQFLT